MSSTSTKLNVLFLHVVRGAAAFLQRVAYFYVSLTTLLHSFTDDPELPRVLFVLFPTVDKRSLVPIFPVKSFVLRSTMFVPPLLILFSHNLPTSLSAPRTQSEL